MPSTEGFASEKLKMFPFPMKIKIVEGLPNDVVLLVNEREGASTQVGVITGIGGEMSDRIVELNVQLVVLKTELAMGKVALDRSQEVLESTQGQLARAQKQNQDYERRWAELLRMAPESKKEQGWDLNEWRDRIHDLAKAKGWWEEDGSPLRDQIAKKLLMIHAEVSECAEDLRVPHVHPRTFSRVMDGQGNMKPEGMPVELADVIIRCLDLCGALNIDIDRVVDMKHDYNISRPHRHGGKLL